MESSTCCTSFDSLHHLMATDILISKQLSGSLQQKQPSGHLEKIHTKYLNNTDFNGLKVPFQLRVAFLKSLHLYIHEKCHRLPRISEKVHITVKFQKTEMDKDATSGGRAFNIRCNYCHYCPTINYCQDLHNSY